jgi:two-component system, OmpR family, sensor histidine kinase BaeS
MTEKMRISITYRLFLSILAATCIALLCMFLIMHWSITRGFLQYLEASDRARTERLVQTLQQVYTDRQGWGFLRDNPGALVEQLLAGSERHLPPWQEGKGPGGHGPDHPPPLPHGPLRMPFVVLDADRSPVVGGQIGSEKVVLKPVVVRNQTVGYAGFRTPPIEFMHPEQMRFLAQQKWVFIGVGLGLVLVVMLFSFPLSRYLLQPVRAMAAATIHLTSGNYAVRIPVSSSDELGRLAGSFNVMALTLEKNEKARRQWVADISHELRTPLAVLRAEIEALLEGVRETTPEAVSSLHAEVLRLHRLVDDLYQLALSDLGNLTYHREELDLSDILNNAVRPHFSEFKSKGITVRMNLPDKPGIIVFADRERLLQLFANLLDNSLKYTDAEGELIVGIRCVNGQATITFEDSYPGVTGEEMERLFDRLYRVESSRNRALGGAGLGLAICKNIVEAHEGTIFARPSVLGGVLVEISLPAEEGYG